LLDGKVSIESIRHPENVPFISGHHPSLEPQTAHKPAPERPCRHRFLDPKLRKQHIRESEAAEIPHPPRVERAVEMVAVVLHHAGTRMKRPRAG